MPSDEAGPLTAIGQQQWRERIRKESARITGAPRGSFNIRSAMAAPGVPLNFKPNSVTPKVSPRRAEEGADLGASMSRDLRAALSMQASSPRQRCLWSETHANDVGWLVGGERGDIPLDERGTMAGTESALGIGWRGRTAIGRRRRLGLLDEAPPAAPAQAHEVSFMPILVAAPLAVAPEDAAASEATTLLGVAKAARRITRKKREQRKVPVVAALEPPPPSRERAATAKADALPPAQPPPSAPVALARPGTGHEQGVEAAVQRSRAFLPRMGASFYRPNCTSDVVRFADVYARSWGVNPHIRRAT